MPQEHASSSANDVIFGEAGPRMRRAGFAVLPAKGKKPLMQGFDRWKHAPGPAAVEKWAVRNPDADLVYVPGLSRAKGGGDAIIVVDGDDAEASGRIVELFGDTPGKVRTRRGRHFLYRCNGRSLGKVQSLRAYGLDADVKHGRSIVVAPPSRHAEDRTFVYTWDGCDETVLRDLPAFEAGALQALIDRAKPNPHLVETQTPTRNLRNYVTNNCPPAAPPRLDIKNWIARSKNSRGLALNSWLIKQLAACDSLNALLDCARMFNAELIAAGLGSLEADNELMERTAAVWKDYQAGKIEPWEGGRSVARTDAEEAKHLSTFDHGGDACLLLMLLRSEHNARVLRGEPFVLRVEAMAKAGTLDWSPERFYKAIKTLLSAGYIRVVEEARNTRSGRLERQYTLVPRTLSVLRDAFESQS